MALYDIADMAELTREMYTRLRDEGGKSAREKAMMREIRVERGLWDFVEGWEGEGFQRLEDVRWEGRGNVVLAVAVRLNGAEMVEELDRWYREEHVGMLAQVPGWLRTRRFVTSTIEGKGEGEREYLALHEYALENGLGGREFKKAATSTKWNEIIWGTVVREKMRRVWELYYTFGPAPRDLASLAEKEAVAFEAPDGQTRTWPSTSAVLGPAIESFITTADGAELEYRLFGEPRPDAAVIVLSNSILVDWGIWDGFVKAFFEGLEHSGYCVLLYNARGRFGSCGERAVTLDVLAEDLIALLDALRIRKVKVAVGVSLGGATVLNAALKSPERIESFLACDTNAKAPEGNRKTWEDRIAIAEEEGAVNSAGEKIVGEKLAELTVRRWFANESYDGAELEKEIQKVKHMVQENSLQGFKRSVQALWEYDLRGEMKAYQRKGAFVVGGADGVLPGTMKEMAAGLGKGAECHVIDGAGHLPMVERSEEFAQVVMDFLRAGR